MYIVLIFNNILCYFINPPPPPPPPPPKKKNSMKKDYIICENFYFNVKILQESSSCFTILPGI